MLGSPSFCLAILVLLQYNPILLYFLLKSAKTSTASPDLLSLEAISEPPFSDSFLFKEPSTSFSAYSNSPIAGTYQKLEGRQRRALEDDKKMGESRRLGLEKALQHNSTHLTSTQLHQHLQFPDSVFPPDKW